MAAVNSSGKCRGSTNCRKLRLGSAADSTIFAWISSPFSSATPAARPPRTITLRTGAPVRISTPSDRADEAMAAETPPVPFLAKPQARNAPSISPM